jgi:NCAIR mutase (PurE)-related protein
VTAVEATSTSTIAILSGFARLDIERFARTGVPEVVFAEGKTVDQSIALLARLREEDPRTPALATRCPNELLAVAATAFPGEPVEVDSIGRVVQVGSATAQLGDVLILTAGTTDLPVARECAATLSGLGVEVDVLADVGVAGLHRLLDELPRIRRADVVIVVAGMDGALPSVVAGLIAAPVIAVPTSVGYGVAADGIAATLAMLASCSPGLAVVNVDNGFGAAVHAVKIIGLMRRG